MNGSPTPGATTDRPKLITRPALAAASRPRVTVIAWLVLLATGIYAFVFALDREGFPPVNVPIAVVSANWFVDDEIRVDAELATPVFEAYKDVEGVDSVSTFSRPDGFAAVFEFDTSFSSADGVAALNAAAAPALPEGVALEIDPVDATKFLENYDLIVTVIGPNDAAGTAHGTDRVLAEAHGFAFATEEHHVLLAVGDCSANKHITLFEYDSAQTR